MTSRLCFFCAKQAVYTYRINHRGKAVPFCNWHLTVLWLALKSGEFHD